MPNSRWYGLSGINIYKCKKVKYNKAGITAFLIKFMPKVKFCYNFKKDTWSWVLIAKSQRRLKELKKNWRKEIEFIPKKLLNLIIKKNRKAAESLVYNHLVSHSQRSIRQLIIKEQLLFLEKIWRRIEKEFFKRLKKISGKPIFLKEFKCYLTTGFMCPYDSRDNSFMISMWHSIPWNITTICHEIFHLQFLHYYAKYCRKFLSEKKLDGLKEALTFILDTDFKDLLLCKDKGYPAHQKLRKELRKIWGEDKNFDRFLDKAIKIVGKNKNNKK